MQQIRDEYQRCLRMVLRRQTKVLQAAKRGLAAGLSHIERERVRGLIERLMEDVNLLHRMVAAPAGCLRTDDAAWNGFLDGQALYLARLLDHWRIVGDALRLDEGGEEGQAPAFAAELGPELSLWGASAEFRGRKAN